MRQIHDGIFQFGGVACGSALTSRREFGFQLEAKSLLSSWRLRPRMPTTSTQPGGSFRTATVHRRYQDEQQQWHSSVSYGLQQLLQLRAVVDRTITELMDRQTDAV